MPPKLAYLTSRFPHLPETFILREITELERQGWAIEFYPLIRQQQAVVHAEAQHWLERAHRLPYVSGSVLAANVARVVRQPMVYARTLARVLWENRTSPNFLARALALWPKAVYAARLMQAAGITH